MKSDVIQNIWTSLGIGFGVCIGGYFGSGQIEIQRLLIASGFCFVFLNLFTWLKYVLNKRKNRIN